LKKIRIKDTFEKSSIKVPFFLPTITKDDKKVVSEALDRSLLTDGPKLREFESSFAKFTGAKYAVGVSNATSALHLSLKAVGIEKNDEVIVPNMTFIATANAVLLCNAIPVFADVNDDLTISPDSILENITSKTKAILPVHFAGKACNMNQLKKIAKSKNISIIEDCAHAIGTSYNNVHVGNFGKAGCFSFYPTKNITTIEGGMIITNSLKIASFLKTMRNHGITKSLSQRYLGAKPWDYDVKKPGYNYRLDEIRAALGLSQLKRIKRINKIREKLFDYYNSKLNEVEGIITPSKSKFGNDSFHLYICRIQNKFGITRDNLYKKLLSMGIRTTVHYKPLHEYSALKKFKNRHERLENSKKIYKEIISLPFYLNMTKKEQDIVVNYIKKIKKKMH